jgi:hypothetical protein
VHEQRVPQILAVNRLDRILIFTKLFGPKLLIRDRVQLQNHGV